MQASPKIAATRHSTIAMHLSSSALLVALFMLACLPRIAGLGDTVTIDEASKWFNRSERFLTALREESYADTNRTGHPGVTTMWLGSAGVLLYEQATHMGWIATDDLAAYRLLLRLPAALINALGVVLGYWLLQHLFERRIALLAAMLWATEPFLVAHGQVLHLDGLLTSFMTLAILAALVAYTGQSQQSHQHQAIQVQWRWLVFSAIAGGLAFLTKAPSVFLLPMIGLIVLVDIWKRQYTGSRSMLHNLGTTMVWTLLVLLAWIGIAVGTWALLWPAVWVDPGPPLIRMINEVRDNGALPHNTGNFFLGRTIADPGLFFYPVVIALRLTPWTLIGLGLALLAAVDRRPGTKNDQRWAIAMLVIFTVLFTIMMSLAAKKFDRYILPIFPPLTIFAAIGWGWLLARLSTLAERATHRRTDAQTHKFTHIFWQAFLRIIALPFVGKGLILIILIINLIWYHPYYLSYYNPLLGGGRIAAWAIPVGWGEGYEQAGAFISEQFNGCDKPVASWFGPVLHHFVCSDVVSLATYVTTPAEIGYTVLYIDQIQRNNEPEAINQLYGKVPPVHTVRIHGIDYAFVYQVEPPVARPLAVDFGDVIHLRGYNLDPTAIRSSGTLTLTLDWQVRAPMQIDYMLFVHVLDSQGHPVAQVDVPPNGQGAPTSQWQSGRYITLIQPVPVPTDIADAPYWITIGLYDPQTFARLPLRGLLPTDMPDDGPNALPLGSWTLP